MDFSELQTEVRERIGETEADFYTDDEVKRAINTAVRRFCNEERWPFLLTEWTSGLSAGDDELDLPSDISLTRVFNLALTGGSIGTQGGRVLERIEPGEGFRMRFLYDQHPTVPRWYYITRSDLDDTNAPPVTYTAKLIPEADDDYDVEAQYMAVPTTMTGGSEEPMVPTPYQEAITAEAAGQLYLKELGISQKASEQFQVYFRILSQARNDMKEFNLDEVVALGRSHPLGRRDWAMTDPRFRTPPTLG